MDDQADNDAANEGNAQDPEIKDVRTGNLSKSLLILGALGMVIYALLSLTQAVQGESWEGTFFNARATYGMFNLFMILFFFGIVMHFINLQFQRLADIADEIDDEELYVPDPDWKPEGDVEELTEEELKEEEDELGV